MPSYLVNDSLELRAARTRICATEKAPTKPLTLSRGGGQVVDQVVGQVVGQVVNVFAFYSDEFESCRLLK